MNDTHTTGFNPSYAAQEPTPAAVRALPGWTLLEFGAAWCGVCRGTQPALQAAMAAHARLRHLKVADGRGQPLGRAFGVKLWPTLVLLHDGAEVARRVRPGSQGEIDGLLAESLKEARAG